jgi:uncharacterized membrane protein (DUF4010 family)
MMDAIQGLQQTIPPEALQLLLVLFLSFLIGLEREGRKTESALGTFGGVRTFPLIGLLGYGLALLSDRSVLPEAMGLAGVAILMAIALWYKFAAAEAAKTPAGVTSEISGLIVYVIGVLVQHGLFWISATLTIACLLLLELKAALEHLSQTLPGQEVLTFSKFLVLSVVILPIVPNQAYGPFAINPFKTWLVVVAVTGISYGSYLLQRFWPAAGSVRLTAVLGGAYSSTLATVALARKAASIGQPRLVAGSILMASGMMYVRIAALVSIFSRSLMRALALPFLGLAALALLAGWLWSLRKEPGGGAGASPEARNPLELSAAFLFAFLFVAMLVASKLTLSLFGAGGVFSLAAIMGVTDVDPFILGVAQGTDEQVPLPIAAAAIVIASASNNLVKGIYGRVFADRATGTQTLVLLGGLAVVGLVPLLWLL